MKVEKGLQNSMEKFVEVRPDALEKMGAANVDELLLEYEDREEELYKKLESEFGAVPDFDVSARGAACVSECMGNLVLLLPRGASVSVDPCGAGFANLWPQL